jgi:hypothetical protein
MLIMGMGFTACAQSTRAYVGLGAAYHAFQDARFSDLQITSFSPDLELGFSYMTDRSYVLAHADGFTFVIPQPNAGKNTISSIGFNVRAGWLPARDYSGPLPGGNLEPDRFYDPQYGRTEQQ